MYLWLYQPACLLSFDGIFDHLQLAAADQTVRRSKFQRVLLDEKLALPFPVELSNLGDLCQAGIA